MSKSLISESEQKIVSVDFVTLVVQKMKIIEVPALSKALLFKRILNPNFIFNFYHS